MHLVRVTYRLLLSLAPKLSQAFCKAVLHTLNYVLLGRALSIEVELKQSCSLQNCSGVEASVNTPGVKYPDSGKLQNVSGEIKYHTRGSATRTCELVIRNFFVSGLKCWDRDQAIHSHFILLRPLNLA